MDPDISRENLRETVGAHPNLINVSQTMATSGRFIYGSGYNPRETIGAYPDPTSISHTKATSRLFIYGSAIIWVESKGNHRCSSQPDY